MKTIISTHRTILLDVQGSNVWSGQQPQSFNSNAVTWGALAQHLYSPGGRYWIVPFSVLLGLLVPIPFWLIHQKFPHAKADKVVTPILCCKFMLLLYPLHGV
jgi:OPT oligopeptide transporter protein